MPFITISLIVVAVASLSNIDVPVCVVIRTLFSACNTRDPFSLSVKLAFAKSGFN